MIDHDNLEEFNDPANYDLEEAEDSIPRIAFYCNLAEEVGGPALEVACGTGLVALPIAARGLDVTGIDLSHPMLDYMHLKAQKRQIPIRLIEADARQFRLGMQYQFIYMTGNAFQAFLRREDQEAVLATINLHLVPHGTFAFETRNPSGHDLATRHEEEHWLTYTSVEGQPVTVSGTQIYNPLTQVMHWTTYRRWSQRGRVQTKETRIACRFTYPQELEALLHYNGYRILKQYGDWNKVDLAANSPTIISICTLR